ncbi:hypothetical protein MTO96_046364 [Rhipicephalus appendiculatus]
MSSIGRESCQYFRAFNNNVDFFSVPQAPPCPPQWLRSTERPPGKPSPEWTEDCLHVNLWTPGLSPAKLRPVVVLLHGGHFTHGSNRQRQYDGARMATRCDCVVAVPNYRCTLLCAFVADWELNVI